MKMNKKFSRKGDGLSSIIITIVFIIIVILVVPAFRGMQKDNTSSTKALSGTTMNFTDSGVTDASKAGYNLNQSDWSNSTVQ